jgi:uncharacterized RDD family membrane protein YckC
LTIKQNHSGTLKKERAKRKRKQDIDVENNLTRLSAKLASRWKRFAGYIIDKVIVYVVSVILRLAVFKNIMENINSAEMKSLIVQSNIFIGYSSAYLLLNAWLLVSKGQTIGKTLMRTRIVNLAGEKVPLWKVFFLREMLFWGLFCLALDQLPQIIQRLYIIFLIINGMFIVRTDRRCIHDLVCGTQVIDV